MEVRGHWISMAVQLNHTIVGAHDKWASAQFLTEILGLTPPRAAGVFVAVQLDNDVTLDFAEPGADHIRCQHLAFLVSEDDFDAAFASIRERGLMYWADPRQQFPGEINTNDGGRGVYFLDPNGHALELITRPYGSGGSA